MDDAASACLKDPHDISSTQSLKSLMADLTTPDFTTTSLEGQTRNRQQLIEEQDQPPAVDGRFEVHHSFYIIDVFNLEKDRASVGVIHVSALTFTDGSKTSEMLDVHKSQDVWLKTAQGWKMKETKVVWKAESLDGQAAQIQVTNEP
jgi:uncharacterized protein YaiE (UPF0345 family)